MKSRRSLMAASVFSGKRESRESHLLHRHSLSAIRQSEPKVSLSLQHRCITCFRLEGASLHLCCPLKIHLDPLVRQVDDR